jgi:Guanylylate cyclase
MISLIGSVADWLLRLGVATKEDRVDFIGEYDLIHVGQKHNWDCGLACLEMSQRWWRMDEQLKAPTSFHAREFEDKGSPLWTIDIFLNLFENGVDGAVMYTTCKGS